MHTSRLTFANVDRKSSEGTTINNIEVNARPSRTQAGSQTRWLRLAKAAQVNTNNQHLLPWWLTSWSQALVNILGEAQAKAAISGSVSRVGGKDGRGIYNEDLLLVFLSSSLLPACPLSMCIKFLGQLNSVSEAVHVRSPRQLIFGFGDLNSGISSQTNYEVLRWQELSSKLSRNVQLTCFWKQNIMGQSNHLLPVNSFF